VAERAAGSTGRAVITDGARRMDDGTDGQEARAGGQTFGPFVLVESAGRPAGIVCGTYQLLAATRSCVPHWTTWR